MTSLLPSGPSTCRSSPTQARTNYVFTYSITIKNTGSGAGPADFTPLGHHRRQQPRAGSARPGRGRPPAAAASRASSSNTPAAPSWRRRRARCTANTSAWPRTATSSKSRFRNSCCRCRARCTDQRSCSPGGFSSAGAGGVVGCWSSVSSVPEIHGPPHDKHQQEQRHACFNHQHPHIDPYVIDTPQFTRFAGSRRLVAWRPAPRRRRRRRRRRRSSCRRRSRSCRRRRRCRHRRRPPPKPEPAPLMTPSTFSALPGWEPGRPARSLAGVHELVQRAGAQGRLDGRLHRGARRRRRPTARPSALSSRRYFVPNQMRAADGAGHRPDHRLLRAAAARRAQARRRVPDPAVQGAGRFADRRPGQRLSRA